MIAALTGTVFDNNNPIVLFVGGVGYSVHVPEKLISRLTVGQTHTLRIHTHVRDDTLELYGFMTPEELTLFEHLLTVSGIGPRTALAVVDRGVNQVQRAVTQADVDFFTTIPRLGRKNAQKIIIELKTKLGSLLELDLTREASGETKQILDALVSMGFTKNEALEAINRTASEDWPIEQKIRHALKTLGKS